MTYAIYLLKRMDKKYPSLLTQLTQQPDILSSYKLMHTRKVEAQDMTALLSLRSWCKDKVIYNFDPGIAAEIIETTEDPDGKIPLDILTHLPYPCIAVRVTPLSVMDARTNRVIADYTGNAFIWVEEERIISTWELDGGTMEWTSLSVTEDVTIDECFDKMVEGLLKMAFISDKEVPLIKKLLDIEHFYELQQITERHMSRLRNRLSPEKAQSVLNVIEKANQQEVLLHRIIHIILYLNCTNADIEAAEDKIRAGAQASILLGGEPISQAQKKRILREHEGSTIMDVGYRITGKYHKGLSSTTEEENPNRNQGTRGYSKRRAHLHHFWIGPRTGPIAEDIMNPQAGERGLILRWVDATEIHPELKDEQAIIVPVEE